MEAASVQGQELTITLYTTEFYMTDRSLLTALLSQADWKIQLTQHRRLGRKPHRGSSGRGGTIGHSQTAICASQQPIGLAVPPVDAQSPFQQLACGLKVPLSQSDGR